MFFIFFSLIGFARHVRKLRQVLIFSKQHVFIVNEYYKPNPTNPTFSGVEKVGGEKSKGHGEDAE